MSRRAAVVAGLLSAAAVLCVAPTLHAQPAGPASSESCISDYEQGQQHQKAGRLVKALQSFTGCAQDACPSVVRQQCALALPELEQSVPSIVFDATDADNNQIIDVRVDVDGATLATRLDGRAVSLDPGRHVVRFERPGGAVVEQEIVLLEGQRRRTVRARFGAQQATRPDEDGDADDTSGERPFGPIPWIVAGVGLAAAGAGLTLLIIGQNEISDAEDDCSGRVCTDPDAVELGNAGRSKSLAGKVLLSAGGALVAGGLIWQFAGNRPRPAPPVALRVEPHAVEVRWMSRF